MTDRELETLMRGIAPVVREAIATAQAPLLARIASLEARQPIAGRDGRDGIAGIQGERGPQGEKGERGESVKGDRGDRGESAYEIAVRLGFHGTEAQWLESLRGRDGRDGNDGKSLRVGRGKPTDNAVAKDIYIDVDTGEVYQCD